MVILPSIDFDFGRRVVRVSSISVPKFRILIRNNDFQSSIDHSFCSLRSLSSIAILAKAERQGEEMNSDWYAFNGLPKDQIERSRKIYNEDWEVTFNIQDPSKDQDLNRITIHLLSKCTVH